MIEPKMIEIPGGSFWMGCETGADDEKPIHLVFLGPFQIGKYPVTNREYTDFLQESGYRDVPLFLDEADFNDPHQPVTGISWYDALAYSEWLSWKTEKEYRLPTEAEWEYAACSGENQNIYPWGTRKWDELPELHKRFDAGPSRVGEFEPNPLGIYDLCINVHEWCSDWYDRDYYAVSPPRNPRGPNNGSRRASRGGSWRHQIKISRCAARSSIPPGMRYADYGFRVAI